MVQTGIVPHTRDGTCAKHLSLCDKSSNNISSLTILEVQAWIHCCLAWKLYKVRRHSLRLLHISSRNCSSAAVDAGQEYLSTGYLMMPSFLDIAVQVLLIPKSGRNLRSIVV